MNKIDAQCIKKDIFKLFKKRNEKCNKGDFGRALLICGSYGMAGAAIISAKSCIASGIGICDIACQKSIYPIVSSSVPEAVCTPISEEFDIKDRENLKKSLKKADCVVIGCGTGNSDYTNKILQLVLQTVDIPLIIDADGLNVLSKDLTLLNKSNSEIIVTPHPGEMSRLINKSINEIENNRICTAVNFSKEHGVVTLLKGHNTVISNTQGEYFINNSGNAGMATGGSGDMLCGIIAALICDNFSVFDAARAGAYIHGLAGDLSAEKFSQHSTSATTMTRMLSDIFLEIENQ